MSQSGEGQAPETDMTIPQMVAGEAADIIREQRAGLRSGDEAAVALEGLGGFLADSMGVTPKEAKDRADRARTIGSMGGRTRRDQNQ